MEKLTKEDIVTKLKYLDLDLENIPDFLNQFKLSNFNISRLNNDRDHRVFRYIPIDKIEILLTPCLRSDSIKKKYSEAVPLFRYINPSEEEEDIERYATFLKLVTEFAISEVENISTIQKELEKAEPFRVTYAKDNLWQIYYSETADRYFMLVCTKESTFSEFFYLLKKKIEFNRNNSKNAPKIYVPINYLNYCEVYLNINEISDLENYLWLFTKNWALIFEVFNKNNNLSLQIVGDTFVYDNVKSSYKIKLTNKEDAIKLYKLLKALFIMQTEIKKRFEFTTKIDSKNNLELYLGKTRITYDSLTEFIKSEFFIAVEEIKVQDENIDELEKKLNDLKINVNIKEEEYMLKQKEISTYLECRKTFFGKVKYFLKSNKTDNKNIEKLEDNKKTEIAENEIINQPVKTYVEDKQFYTIEDLVVIYSTLEKKEKKYKNLNQDIKALELKLENYISKVKNANLYIDEIDKHKKSIFDFWKFANKDEKLSLEEGFKEEKGDQAKKIKKAFDFEMDFEDLGIKVDNIQRKKLLREEEDSIFIAKTKLLYVLNMIRCNELDKFALETALDSLKEEFNKNRLYIDSETFDIFGNVEDDNRRIKYLGSRSHRENEKSKFKILNINKRIDVFDFTEKLQSIVNYIESAISKTTSIFDISLYKLVPITEKIKEGCFDVFNISVENELKEYQDNGEGALNLIKINYKEGMPITYYSNIIFYDNTNQTLPEGMDISSNVLIDCSKYDFKLLGKTKFRTNNYFTESNNLILPKSKDIFVYEYDVSYKNDKE